MELDPPFYPRYTGRSEAERREQEEIKIERKSGRRSVSVSLSKCVNIGNDTHVTRHRATDYLNRNYKINLRSVLEESVLERSTSQTFPSNPFCFHATHRPWQPLWGLFDDVFLPVFFGGLLVSIRSSSPPQVCWLGGWSVFFQLLMLVVFFCVTERRVKTKREYYFVGKKVKRNGFI